MNETPACLLAMLTQTRKISGRRQSANGARRHAYYPDRLGTSYHGALTARSFMQQWCGLPVDVYWPFRWMIRR